MIATKKKLILINPAPGGQSVISEHVLKLPPLTLGHIAALTPPHWEVQIIDETVSKLNFEEADLVGLTAFTFNAPRAYEIADSYKKKGIPVIMGGIHASVLPEEAVNYVDSIVIGEVENIWTTIISDFEKGQLKRKYTGDRCSMRSLPVPRRELFADKYLPIDTIQTARGCPMNCDFCSVTVVNGGTYRQRPIEDILNELQLLNRKTVFFIDDNILGYGTKAEERAIKLFKGIIERNIKIRWASQSSVNIVRNPEVLKYAALSGCFMLLIGFESINHKSLKDMNKAENLKDNARKYKNVIKRLHDHGITIMGAFILGSDYDDKSIFDATGDFIMSSGIDMANFSIMCPFPGTRLYDKLAAEDRLFYTNFPHDWQYYKVAAQHVLFQPKLMTPEELIDGTMQLYKHTTSISSSGKRALKTLFSSRSMISTVFSYSWNRNMHKNVRLTYGQ